MLFACLIRNTKTSNKYKSVYATRKLFHQQSTIIVYNYYTKKSTLIKSTDKKISMGAYLEIINGIIVDFHTSICVHISNADIKNIITQYLTKRS